MTSSSPAGSSGRCWGVAGGEVEVGVHEAGRVAAGEGGSPGEGFVEHAAQAVDVDAGVGVARVGEAFGGHVGHGSHGQAGGGQAGGGGVAGDAEVDEVDEVGVFVDAGVDEQDVRGFDVAVDESGAVGGVEGAGGLGDDGDGSLGAQGAGVGEDLGEVAAFDQGHVQEQSAVDFAVVVDGDDVGAAESGGGVGFAAESFFEFGAGELGGESFEGDESVAFAGVGGAEDLAHPAAAQQRFELVGPERLRHPPPPTFTSWSSYGKVRSRRRPRYTTRSPDVDSPGLVRAPPT